METIICKCGQQQNLSAQACCLSCHERIFTMKELNDQLSELRREAERINFKMMSIGGEIFLRQRRIHIDKEKRMVATGNVGFYDNVKKAPRGEKGKQSNRDYTKEARELLAMLED